MINMEDGAPSVKRTRLRKKTRRAKFLRDPLPSTASGVVVVTE
jgi:hypothetical protein